MRVRKPPCGLNDGLYQWSVQPFTSLTPKVVRTRSGWHKAFSMLAATKQTATLIASEVVRMATLHSFDRFWTLPGWLGPQSAIVAGRASKIWVLGCGGTTNIKWLSMLLVFTGLIIGCGCGGLSTLSAWVVRIWWEIYQSPWELRVFSTKTQILLIVQETNGLLVAAVLDWLFVGLFLVDVVGFAVNLNVGLSVSLLVAVVCHCTCDGLSGVCL